MKVKAIVAKRGSDQAEKVAGILRDFQFEVSKVARSGVYFDADKDKLEEVFQVEVDEENHTLASFKIPEELKDLVVAIYTPSKPTFF